MYGSTYGAINAWLYIWSHQCMALHMEPSMHGSTYGAINVWLYIWSHQCMALHMEPSMYGSTYGAINVWLYIWSHQCMQHAFSAEFSFSPMRKKTCRVYFSELSRSILYIQKMYTHTCMHTQAHTCTHTRTRTHTHTQTHTHRCIGEKG